MKLAKKLVIIVDIFSPVSFAPHRGPPLCQLHGVIYKGPMYQIALNFLSSLTFISDNASAFAVPYTLMTLPVG